jgi:ABC-type nitrate/sulfonate/bicarbonate transport system ATPase subunit
MAHRKCFPGADPSNLWGNAREGSEVASELQSRARGPSRPAASGEPIVLSGVSFAYRGPRGSPLQALAEVSLRCEPGALVAVVGPSGCGKSTLLELLCGLRAPDAGSLSCPPAVLMPQRDLLLPWLSALDNAALALRIAGLRRAPARARALELFCELGLEDFHGARPHELSGGMRQRVAFLRTLLAGKPVLCLDEPFGALDAITRGEMQEWLASTLAREPRTVVLVTHDVEEAVLLGDTVLVLCPRPGRVGARIAVELERPRVRTEDGVIALRERALAALAEGSRR